MTPSLDEAVSAIRKYAPNFNPKVGIILGSGLSSLAEQIQNPIAIPYQAFGLSTGGVAGHASLLILGHLNGVPVVCLKGRLHMYEGVSSDSVALLVRIVRQLGAKAIVITGASGSLRREVGAGEIMVINDHINFHPSNPLVGPNNEAIGPRFVSLENAYDSEFNEIFLRVAGQLGIPMHTGVYLATLGPVFETPAEIRAYKILGADAVGMSVVPEVIVARHCGLRVLGLAAITNLAVGMSTEHVTHEGTLHYGELTARKLVKMIPEFLKAVEPLLDG
ncbi:MAG: purine-nucleoside phosphorylase [Gammaproteobacteria bacterium]|nr:purine-nucleoside phosphorylase [Gammaproteobacteria bacterium]